MAYLSLITMFFYITYYKVEIRRIILGSVWLLVKPFVLICTADLLGGKNTVPWLMSRFIMTAEHCLKR